MQDQRGRALSPTRAHLGVGLVWFCNGFELIGHHAAQALELSKHAFRRGRRAREVLTKLCFSALVTVDAQHERETRRIENEDERCRLVLVLEHAAARKVRAQRAEAVQRHEHLREEAGRKVGRPQLALALPRDLALVDAALAAEVVGRLGRELHRKKE